MLNSVDYIGHLKIKKLIKKKVRRSSICWEENNNTIQHRCAKSRPVLRSVKKLTFLKEEGYALIL